MINSQVLADEMAVGTTAHHWVGKIVTCLSDERWQVTNVAPAQTGGWVLMLVSQSGWTTMVLNPSTPNDQVFTSEVYPSKLWATVDFVNASTLVEDVCAAWGDLKALDGWDGVSK